MSEGKDAYYFANAIGLIVDRTSDRRQVLASAWLLAEGKVATMAESLVIYERCADALEIVFPSAGQRFAVKRIVFHPQFKRRSLARTVEETIRDTGSSKSVKDHNCAVLYLDDKVSDLSEARRAELVKSLSLRFAGPEQGLSGSLAEIEFSLLIQTLCNARKQGELIIVDDRNYPVAQVFCDSGRIRFARYRHLTNELAVYQMVAQKLKNKFFFHSAGDPSWLARKQIEVAPDVLLIESYRRLDELEKLRAGMAGDPCFIRKKGEAELERLPPDWQEEARLIWSVADGLTAASRLWHLVNLDDQTIFKTLPLLCELELLAVSDSAWIDPVNWSDNQMQSRATLSASATAPILPLPVAPQLGLSPGDLLASIVVDGRSYRRGIKHGQLFGAVDAFDSYQLIHNLPMLPEFAGCPIFKNGYVVAMQVGALPSNPEVSLPVLQQCLWVESIMDCLSRSGEAAMVKELTREVKPSVTALLPLASSEALMTIRPSVEQAGCVEVANLDCPRCGLSSFHTAQFCENCNFELIPIERVSKGSGETLVLEMLSKPSARSWGAISAVLGLLIIIACLTSLILLPQANLAASPGVYLGRRPWLNLSVKQANAKLGTWETPGADKIFKNGDTIYLNVDVLKPCYVYLLHQTDKATPELIYPQPDKPGKLYSAGVKITYPDRIEERSPGGSGRLIGMTFAGDPGTETFICIAASAPLKLTSSRSVFDQVNHNTALVYGWDSFPNGFEIDQNVLEQGAKPGEGLKSVGLAERERFVYVTRLIASHQR
ncbi:MAG: hypothetical protein C5B53_02720 [Candidatus Melainabacteria bacterium]|nr:MAG: hypothetical protein C5B53_02720 [Candidatus Melainabacteria bacterium]